MSLEEILSGETNVSQYRQISWKLTPAVISFRVPGGTEGSLESSESGIRVTD